MAQYEPSFGFLGVVDNRAYVLRNIDSDGVITDSAFKNFMVGLVYIGDEEFALL